MLYSSKILTILLNMIIHAPYDLLTSIDPRVKTSKIYAKSFTYDLGII